MTKLKAFIIHLIISLGIFLVFFSVTRFIWYPSFYFSASGAWDAMFTVAFVDVVLGPLLTLVLYKRGKPGLKFDLSMIALFQISALVWGMWVLYSERPVLTVYHEDSFYCLSDPLAKAANANLTTFKTEGIIPQALLPVPKTPEEARARETVMKTLPNDGVRPNLPAYVFGEQFEPITPENISEILANELDITRAVKSEPEYEQIWEAFRNTHKEAAARSYAFFPLRCSATEHLAALERKTGVIVDSMAIPSLNAIRKNFLTPQKRRDNKELLFPE